LAFYLPLVGSALGIVRQAARSTNGDLLFPGKSGDRPFKVQSLGVAMHAFCEHHQGSWLVDRPTPHDLRRTARTGLSMLKVAPEDAQAVLNHRPAGIDARVYDCYQRADEKRHALQLWNSRVEAIIGGHLSNGK
jgi:integrase